MKPISVAIILIGTSLFATNAYADSVALSVTKISPDKPSATADGTFANGWRWIFDVTVPQNETVLKLKFTDWTSGSNAIPAVANVAIYSAQSRNAVTAASAVAIKAVGAYSDPLYLDPAADLDPAQPGRQIQVVMETSVPPNTAGGTYSTSYGIESDVDAPVITLNGSPTMSIPAGTRYVDAGAAAHDALDGDLTPSIHVTGLVDILFTGTYTLTYTVTDSAGAAAVPVVRTVTVTTSGISALVSEIALAKSTIQASANGNVGGAPGQYSQSTVDALTEAILTATHAVTDPGSQSDTDAALAALTAAVSAFQPNH